jgi:hypothetical protein
MFQIALAHLVMLNIFIAEWILHNQVATSDLHAASVDLEVTYFFHSLH